MTDAPYIKLSRRLVSSGTLARLSQGKAALLWLFLAVEQDEYGIAMVTYQQIMQGTGIGSRATIAGLLESLDTCGLIGRLDPDPEHGAGRYQLLGDWTRYKSPGAPEGEGSTETVPPRGVSTETVPGSGTETVLSLRSVVVPDSGDSDSPGNQESVLENGSTTTPFRDGTETVPPPGSETVPPLDPRLERLELPVDVAQLQEWVDEYGLETVIEKARWYDFKRLRGGADTPGWLLTALRDGWTDPPAGFNENVYLTDRERRLRYVSGKFKDEIDY